jgi:ribosomal protein L11 methyltransferase
MYWIKVSISTRPEALPALEAIFLEEGVGTVQEGTEAEPRICAYFPAPLSQELENRLTERVETIRCLGLDLGRGLLEKEQVKEENWASEWKKYYHPLPIGDRFLICPSWELKTEPGRITLALDPGQAFGTGYHPTTQLCLELIEDIRPGTVAFDLGTGSGILAIALAKLGARVVAFDADPVAVLAARENAALNQVELELCHEDLATCTPPSGASVVVANLTADLHLALAEKLPAFVAQGGTLIAGGINCQRQVEVQAALEQAGFSIKKVSGREEWVSFVGRKN